MSMIVVCVLLFSTIYWLLRSRSNKQPTPKKAQSTPRPRSPYLATSINPGGYGCSAVEALGKARYLCSGNVPKLPLAECTSSNCTCAYVRHEDRRSSQDDRRAIYSMQTDMHGLEGGSERRVKRGRREGDRSTGNVSDLGYADFKWTT